MNIKVLRKKKQTSMYLSYGKKTNKNERNLKKWDLNESQEDSIL